MVKVYQVIPGRDNHQMMEGIHEGEIDSLYLYGEDTGIVDSNINFVQAALEKVGFLVVQDEFFTFTASYADVVLPASPSLEKNWNIYKYRAKNSTYLSSIGTKGRL
ncbi:formate dehydrogenase [Staphylococcus gallinarum]|uniref:Formate dehydrogenase n=1 Tax=Staphylococcus gallinarum TaxID=1293 RepID=A0A380FLC2_STAGA|nr:formate dehydrogenase [Staphylococcus gallinarum]